MEIDIKRLKELIEKREKIDEEIQAVAGGKRKVQTCNHCGAEGHSTRWCPDKEKKSSPFTPNPSL